MAYELSDITSNVAAALRNLENLVAKLKEKEKQVGRSKPPSSRVPPTFDDTYTDSTIDSHIQGTPPDTLEVDRIRGQIIEAIEYIPNQLLPKIHQEEYNLRGESSQATQGIKNPIEETQVAAAYTSDVGLCQSMAHKLTEAVRRAKAAVSAPMPSSELEMKVYSVGPPQGNYNPKTSTYLIDEMLAYMKGRELEQSTHYDPPFHGLGKQSKKESADLDEQIQHGMEYITPARDPGYQPFMPGTPYHGRTRKQRTSGVPYRS